MSAKSNNQKQFLSFENKLFVLINNAAKSAWFSKKVNSHPHQDENAGLIGKNKWTFVANLMSFGNSYLVHFL